MKVQEKMRRAKTAILTRNKTGSFADIINCEKDAFSGLRVLFASDVSGANLKFEETPNIANIFTGVGLLAYSREIEQQMNKGQSDLVFELRVLFDLNVLSDLPRYFTGELSNEAHKVKVKKLLDFVNDKLNRSFDISFAALENSLEARNPNNPYPHRKVAAAKAYDSVGPSASSKDIDSNRAQAERFWLSWLTNEEVWNALHRRDLVYCLLLKAHLLRWSEASVGEGVLELVKLSLGCFERLALKEIYFGWKILRGVADPAMLMDIVNEPPLNYPTKKSIERIRALAWDLFIFRWCETLLSQHKGTKFFVPVVSTFDNGLLEAIKLCPLRALIMDEDTKQVEAIFDDELEFQSCLRGAIDSEIDIKVRLDNPQCAMFTSSSFANVSEKIRELEFEINSKVAR